MIATIRNLSFVLALGCLLTAGCTLSRQPGPFAEPPPPTASNPALSRKVTTPSTNAAPIQTSNPHPVAFAEGKPKLAPGDVIDVKVYQEDELTSHVRVDEDGTVTLPLLGTVHVGGETADEASEFIRQALARDYIYNPHVTLTVAESAKKRFSVMGEVKTPGFYLIPEDEKINLLQALSMAGGYTAFSRGTRIQIKRVINGNEVVLWVDAKAMARNKNVEPIEILPGDAITVNGNIF